MANFIQPKPTEVAAAIEALGFKVERAGDGWRAQCPAHDGTDLNLAIDPGRNGAALVTCHSRGCDYRDVLIAVGLADGTPSPVPPPRERTARRQSSESPGEVVTEYHYHSPDGSLAYTKVRYEPKDFRFKPRLSKGCTRWPYRVDEWSEAPEEGADLWIVEGEKDVHTLERLGVRATCNDAGAGNWPKGRKFNKHFEGFNVKILPDNDVAGLAHAQDVARKLAGFAETITILRPVSQGNDVTDFVESYRGARDKILDDLNVDSRLLPNPSPESGFSFMSLEALMSATDT